MTVRPTGQERNDVAKSTSRDEAKPAARRPRRSAPSTAVEKADQTLKVTSTRADGGPGRDLAVRSESVSLGAGTTHQIQTTMQPSVTITVSETEYQALLAQGLVYSGSPVAPAADFYDGILADKVVNGATFPAALAEAAADSGNPFGSGLKAAFAPSGLPSYVSAMPGRYDPLKHLYLPSTAAAQRVDAKLAAARAGTGTMHLVCVGDSETAGQNATGGVPNSWPSLLRGWLSAAGFPVGGTGLAFVGPTNNTGDPRWTRDASWTIPGQLFAQCTVAAKVATFVSDSPGTSVDVWFFGNGPRGATITVDGGSSITYTPSGASVAEKVTITGLANTTHTVAVTSGSNTGPVYLIGANVYSASGIQVHNAGISGSSTTSWLSGSSSFSGWYGLSHLYTPDLVVMSLGVNEALNEGLSVATYTSQYLSLAAKYQALGANIMMLAEPQPSGVSLATWQSFVAAQYQISETLGARMVNILDRWGGYATANANGLMSDTIHPNATGYSDEAFAVRQLILPQ
jgi:lysophospholipase L1-like esterase